jgi:hypothetical protein
MPRLAAVMAAQLVLAHRVLVLPLALVRVLARRALVVHLGPVAVHRLPVKRPVRSVLLQEAVAVVSSSIPRRRKAP